MSSLDDFMSSKNKLANSSYSKFLKLKEKFKNEGLPENIAVYKSLNYLVPQKLEKIKLNADKHSLRIPITFFFDKEDELKLVAKYFKINRYNQVGDSKLLLDLLETIEGIK